MEFIVADRETVEGGLWLHQPYILISIRSPDSRRVAVPHSPHCRGVLSLCFDDTEPGSYFPLPRPMVLMTPADAEAIWRFVGQHRRAVDTIVVHCEAGFSRSPAVAAALAAALGEDDTHFFQEYNPNPHVYQLTRAAARSQ